MKLMFTIHWRNGAMISYARAEALHSTTVMANEIGGYLHLKNGMKIKISDIVSCQNDWIDSDEDT